MELWVLFFTICLVVYATIYVQERLRNGKNSFGFIQVNYERPDSLRARYLKCFEKLSAYIDDCNSMEICREQCHLLRLRCRHVMSPLPGDSTLKVSFCAIRRALKLMQDCCSENWILKAAEFGNCPRHFLEVFLDLHTLPIVLDQIRDGGESLDRMALESEPIDISEETKEVINRAGRFDETALRRRLVDDHWLLDQLEAEATPGLTAPDGIERCVTQFNFFGDSCIYKRDGISVYRVTFCGKEFVVKARLGEHAAEEQNIELRKEATFMKKCRHPYAVALLGYWEFTRTAGLHGLTSLPLLLMESMECDLASIIPRNKRTWWWGGTGGFPALDAINLVLPVAKVMKYLHEIGVVHLDLKPKNILFTRVPGTQDLPGDVSVKLADFGDARSRWFEGQEFEGQEFPRVGTSGYMDPNVWTKGGRVNLVKADVFSFGMVFGEVLTGLSPMEALGCIYAKDFYGKLLRGESLPLPEKTPELVKSIVESCLKLNPNERPSFDVICWKLRKAEVLLNDCT